MDQSEYIRLISGLSNKSFGHRRSHFLLSGHLDRPIGPRPITATKKKKIIKNYNKQKNDNNAAITSSFTLILNVI